MTETEYLKSTTAHNFLRAISSIENEKLHEAIGDERTLLFLWFIPNNKNNIRI